MKQLVSTSGNTVYQTTVSLTQEFDVVVAEFSFRSLRSFFLHEPMSKQNKLMKDNQKLRKNITGFACADHWCP